MLLYNESRQQIDADQLKQHLVKNINKDDKLSEADVQKLLGDYYNQAFVSEAKEYKFEPNALQSHLAQNFSLVDIGKKIFAKIKKFICGVLTSGSNATQIVDAILKALSSVIPGGIVVELIVQKVVNYVVGIGVGKLCDVPAVG
jgi:hypothetical protein